MVTHPVCKINLGLDVIERRPDGMHNLSTVFLPVQLTDTLEIVPLDTSYSKDIFHLTGITLEGGQGEDNLVIKTIQSLRQDYPQIPYVEVWLHKRIPTGAGLGGGSSDAAFTMRMLNNMFNLNISDEEANIRLAKLGADCPFFWYATPCYAEGIGEVLTPIKLDILKQHYLLLIKPQFGVSTREAFGGIKPRKPATSLQERLRRPASEWKTTIGNDFEHTVFPLHPELAAIKETLYNMGAIYAQMSGSGSTMFGIFNMPLDTDYHKIFPSNYFLHHSQLITTTSYNF